MIERRTKLYDEKGLNYPVFLIYMTTKKQGNEDPALRSFCQRYYDSQIGRFITMDRWTHLPDDERLFSYAKYLSWDNYQLKYNPQMTKIPKNISFRRKSYTTAYDSLTNEINSIFPISSTPDLTDSVIYSRKIKNKILPDFRYYQLTERFQNQLNGYRYCWNNPLKYTDPTGCGLDPFTMLLLSELFLGLRLGARFYRMAKELEPGYGYELNFGAGSLWFYMDYDGDYHWKWIWDISISGPTYN